MQIIDWTYLAFQFCKSQGTFSEGDKLKANKKYTGFFKYGHLSGKWEHHPLQYLR